MSRVWRWGLLAAAVAVVAGCGSGAKKQERWSGWLDVSGFNAFLERVQPEAASSPLGAAAEFLRLDRATAQTTSLVSRRNGEGGGPATVIVTVDRLADDSVRAMRYVLELAPRDDGTWRLRSVSRTQRCWPRRGHQSFSPAPCF